MWRILEGPFLADSEYAKQEFGTLTRLKQS